MLLLLSQYLLLEILEYLRVGLLDVPSSFCYTRPEGGREGGRKGRKGGREEGKEGREGGKEGREGRREGEWRESKGEQESGDGEVMERKEKDS